MSGMMDAREQRYQASERQRIAHLVATARRYGRYAVWCRNMTTLVPDSAAFYAPRVAHARNEANAFLNYARQAKAGLQ